MERDNSIQSRLNAAEFLIKHGTEKKITFQYCGSLSGFTERQYASDRNQMKKHRDGTHWLRGDFAYVGVRALRLVQALFGDRMLDRPLMAPEFHALCHTYFTKYPEDAEMSTNRMHYLIQSIRSGEVVIHKNCHGCHLPYVTHRDEAHRRKCSLCLS